MSAAPKPSYPDNPPPILKMEDYVALDDVSIDELQQRRQALKSTKPSESTTPLEQINYQAMYLAGRSVVERMMSEAKNKDLQAINDNLEKLVRKDALTGLDNRLALEEYYEHLRALNNRSEGGNAPAEPSSLALLDLDGFKAINDSAGHKAGDEVLVAVANRLKTGLREQDMVARIGGDENMLLLVGSDVDHALNVFTRLREEVTKPITLESGETVNIDMSVGISPVDFGQPFANNAMQADEAMYVSKREGKGRITVYEPEFQQEVTAQYMNDISQKWAS